MRLLFCDEHDPKEMAQRQAVLSKTDEWWRAFEERRSAIVALFKNEVKWDLPRWMQDHLQAISPDLMWEFGPAVKCEGHRLVITPESEKHLRPLVDLILQRAPQIPGWEFYPYRLPETVERAQMGVSGRTGGSLEGVKANVRTGESGRIDLTYLSPRCKSPDDQQSLNVAFVATEELLGEELLDKWVGMIKVAPLPTTKGILGLFRTETKSPPGTVALDRLKPTVDSLASCAMEQRPTDPCYAWVENTTWSCLELKPQESLDYVRQHDLFVGTTAILDLWQTAHSEMAFYSERFSRCGEVFCYVKLDGCDGLGEEGFRDKAEIQDALNAALVPQQLGCHIGGGTGLRYSYVDLAMADLRRGIDVARSVLAKGKVPRRTWILFFDSTLATEWVGIYDDTPPPTM